MRFGLPARSPNCPLLTALALLGASANHDLDGDSNGKPITVTRP
jgi:hypothetical protein